MKRSDPVSFLFFYAVKAPKKNTRLQKGNLLLKTLNIRYDGDVDYERVA